MSKHKSDVSRKAIAPDLANKEQTEASQIDDLDKTTPVSLKHHAELKPQEGGAAAQGEHLNTSQD